MKATSEIEQAFLDFAFQIRKLTGESVTEIVVPEGVIMALNTATNWKYMVPRAGEGDSAAFSVRGVPIVSRGPWVEKLLKSRDCAAS